MKFDDELSDDESYDYCIVLSLAKEMDEGLAIDIPIRLPSFPKLGPPCYVRHGFWNCMATNDLKRARKKQKQKHEIRST